MLRDRRIEVEVRFARLRILRELPHAFGNFIAGLSKWDWFINPITFRDLRRGLDPDVSIGVKSVEGIRVVFDEDPRITTWVPTWRKHPWRWAQQFGPPVPALALARIEEFLAELQASSSQPIGWVLGEEFGTVGGRYHCHALVSGVHDLRRDEWWKKAHERFGRTRIELFDPNRAAAYYTAKYAAKQLGGLHFGGMLAGVDLKAIEHRQPKCGGGIVVARSAALPRQFFRNTLRRWHR